MSFDWPDFGDSERPKISYNIKILKQTLRAVLQYLVKFKPKQMTLVATGHSASVALTLATESSENWTKLIRVATTWREPLPTMTSWHPKYFGWLRGLVALPILGPVFYHLNTSREILKFMLRRHVWVQTKWLTNERLLEQQKISRRLGSRFASVAFVTGGLDPEGDRSWWISQIKKNLNAACMWYSQNKPHQDQKGKWNCSQNTHNRYQKLMVGWGCTRNLV